MSSISNVIRNKIDESIKNEIKKLNINTIKFEDNKILNKENNISNTLIVIAVKNLIKYQLGIEKEDAFMTSIYGASNIEENYKCFKLLKKINSLDKKSIICACKLATYDVFTIPSSFILMNTKFPKKIKPDLKTIENIRTLVQRGINFDRNYEETFSFDIYFDDNAYTKNISTGKIDFLTNDTIWNYKISDRKYDKNDILKIIIYYLMLKHSDSKLYNEIKKVGIFNPKRNEAYVLEIKNIPKEFLDNIENDVIGYNN